MMPDLAWYHWLLIAWCAPGAWLVASIAVEWWRDRRAARGYIDPNWKPDVEGAARRAIEQGRRR